MIYLKALTNLTVLNILCEGIKECNCTFITLKIVAHNFKGLKPQNKPCLESFQPKRKQLCKSKFYPCMSCKPRTMNVITFRFTSFHDFVKILFLCLFERYKRKHLRNWYKCFIISILLLLSMYQQLNGCFFYVEFEMYTTYGLLKISLSDLVFVQTILYSVQNVLFAEDEHDFCDTRTFLQRTQN